MTADELQDRLDVMFAPHAVRIDMADEFRGGPGEITCSVCRGLMIPDRCWPGGEPVTERVVRAAKSGRIGEFWRCWVCVRVVLVTWRPAAVSGVE